MGLKYLKQATFQDLDADLNNSLFVIFDETYKVKDYFFKSKGKINKANLNFEKPIKNYFFKEGINELALLETDIDFLRIQRGNKA